MAKINSGDNLEKEDYYTIQDYLEEFCDVGELSSNDYESGAEVAREYPYFMYFARALDNAPEDVRQSEESREILTRFRNLMNR